MARAKKRKNNNRRRLEFYESLPMSITPPAATPADTIRLLDEAISFTGRTLRKAANQIITVLDSKHWHYGQIYVLRAATFVKSTNTAISAHMARFISHTTVAATATGAATSRAVKRLAEGIRLSTDAAITYTPPLMDDVATATNLAWRVITGRRAKRLYLSLLLLGTVAAIAFGAVTAYATVTKYASVISSPTTLLANKQTGITILDRNGHVLYEGYGGHHTVMIPMSQMPKSLTDATLAAEDPSFYSEPAISIRGTLRAAWVDFTHHGAAIEGGSTLTQQLVKNSIISPSGSYWRKYQEILLAFALEQRYSRNQIFDMYLNETDYGEGSQGVESASETYFHEPVTQLTLGQSALLAGLPLGPSRFDPNFSVSNATGRRNYVLGRMAQLGYITKQEADQAEAQPIELASAMGATTGAQPLVVYAQNNNIQAPWFVFYVLDKLRQEYGDQMVEHGGLTVKTTLDLSKENIAEKVIQNQIAKIGAAHNVTNGALVSLDPHTGDILAMVGSVNYNQPDFGQVNATLALRQPGSSFKPIVYATAFKKGWNDATTVLDAPITFPGGYAPHNYDLKYHGVVTLRHALDNSLNIPSVKVMQFAGIPASLKTAHEMGITTLHNTSRYGLSLVLGAGDVTMLDMATVYATFDNYGTKVEPRAILDVYNKDGKNITKNTQPKPVKVLDPRIAYEITNILSDVKARLPEFPVNSPLTLSRPAAAKTGTTNNFDDNWTIGYTPQMVTAVWAGNNNHTPMYNVDGVTGAGPIWHNYMEQALAGTPVESFKMPQGMFLATVCEANNIDQGYSTKQQDVFIDGQTPPAGDCNQSNSTYASVVNPDSFSPKPTPANTPAPATPTPTPVPVDTPPAAPAPDPNQPTPIPTPPGPFSQQ